MIFIKNTLVLIAVAFGVITIYAGSNVLLGSDPGYIVYRPLLIFNAGMGVLYVLAGITALRNLRFGVVAAAVIFILNLTVLSTIYYLYTKGSPIAVDSLRAMTLRTVVWLGLFVGFGWLNYTQKKL